MSQLKQVTAVFLFILPEFSRTLDLDIWQVTVVFDIVKSVYHFCNIYIQSNETHNVVALYIQSDSFGTRPQKMRISQRLFIRF